MYDNHFVILRSLELELRSQKQTHRFREHFDSCQMRGGLGEWMKGVKELSSNW